MRLDFFLIMVEPTIDSSRYTYIHDVHSLHPQAIDSHHIVIRRHAAKQFIIYISAVLLIVYAVFFFLQKGETSSIVIWSLLFGALLVNLLIRRQIEKESVIIMPALGVQLETQYRSGRIRRCFVPVSKILKPLLYECVTPVTCYWCLSLLVHEEEELTLVFKECHPPLKMLVPIWKALCAAVEIKEGSESVPFQEQG